MNRLKTAPFQWYVYRLLERTSLAAKLALVLLAMALLAYVWVYRPLQSNLADLTAQKNTPQTAVLPQVDVSAYLARFPALAQRASKIDALMNIAKQQNLLLDEVTYKADTDSKQSLNRYQVAFSVFAPYPQMHHFLSTVLAEMPFVTVESLSINRENVLDEMVEARIQLTFYFVNTI